MNNLSKSINNKEEKLLQRYNNCHPADITKEFSQKEILTLRNLIHKEALKQKYELIQN